MDASIPYADPAQAAAARSCALRWLLAKGVVDDAGAMRQFRLAPEAIGAVLDGAPLLVHDGRARQIDRLVATQSLLLDGYSSDAMAAWFTSRIPGLDGRAASDLLAAEVDATPRLLEAAAAWMA
jgi:hypothetical protein